MYQGQVDRSTRICFRSHNGAGRNRRFVTCTADGYESDSEAFHVSKHGADTFGFESEHDGGKRTKKFAKDPRGTQPRWVLFSSYTSTMLTS